MTDADAIIVRILASADAVRLPGRDWSGHFQANRLSGLKAWGQPFRANGGDDAQRKSGERELVALASDGLIQIQRRGGKKFPLVKLTDRGEAYARALCDLPDREVGVMFLAHVAKRAKRKPRTLDEKWLAENEINDGKGWGEDATKSDRMRLAFIEQDSLPAVSAGWIETGTTIQKHAYYSVTPAGWSELDNPSTPPVVGELPKYIREAAKAYRAEQDIALAALATDTPEWANELGAIPLPVSMVGTEIEPTKRAPKGR